MENEYQQCMCVCSVNKHLCGILLQEDLIDLHCMEAIKTLVLLLINHQDHTGLDDFVKQNIYNILPVLQLLIQAKLRIRNKSPRSFGIHPKRN